MAFRPQSSVMVSGGRHSLLECMEIERITQIEKLYLAQVTLVGKDGKLVQADEFPAPMRTFGKTYLEDGEVDPDHLAFVGGARTSSKALGTFFTNLNMKYNIHTGEVSIAHSLNTDDSWLDRVEVIVEAKLKSRWGNDA